MACICGVVELVDVAADDVVSSTAALTTLTLYFALFTGCEMGSIDDCGSIRFGGGRHVGKKLQLEKS